MSKCKYCGRQLSFTTQEDGECFVCQTYGRPSQVVVSNATEPIDIHISEVIINGITYSYPKSPIKAGDTYTADGTVWTVTEVDMEIEGITISNQKDTIINICHSDKLVYTYNLKGKGKQYLFSFDEFRMINLIMFALDAMLISKLFQKISTK